MPTYRVQDGVAVAQVSEEEDGRLQFEVRDAYRRSIDDALQAVARAERELARLRSDELFDVEYAEGTAGPDMAVHLQAAARALRAVEALNRVLIPAP